MHMAYFSMPNSISYILAVYCYCLYQNFQFFLIFYKQILVCYYNYYQFFSFDSFFTNWWFFHWSLSDSKSPGPFSVYCYCSYQNFQFFLIFYKQILVCYYNDYQFFSFDSFSHQQWPMVFFIRVWVTACPQDPSQYFGRSQQCCTLDVLYSSSYFQVLQSLDQAHQLQLVLLSLSCSIVFFSSLATSWYLSLLTIYRSGRYWVILLHLKIPEKFVRLIF